MLASLIQRLRAQAPADSWKLSAAAVHCPMNRLAAAAAGLRALSLCG
jgi:hypothetical protein